MDLPTSIQIRARSLALVLVCIAGSAAASAQTLTRDGDPFTATYNTHGIVLAPLGNVLTPRERLAQTVYLGSGCDVLTPAQNRGRWRWSGSYIFVEYLDGSTEQYLGQITGDLARRCAL